MGVDVGVDVGFVDEGIEILGARAARMIVEKGVDVLDISGGLGGGGIARDAVRPPDHTPLRARQGILESLAVRVQVSAQA